MSSRWGVILFEQTKIAVRYVFGEGCTEIVRTQIVSVYLQEKILTNDARIEKQASQGMKAQELIKSKYACTTLISSF